MRMITSLACMWVATATAAHSDCRQALVLALDVSGSVNAEEYAQQVQGLAAALNAPDVRELILTATDVPLSLAAFEWSSRNHQHIILPWVDITDAQTLDAAIARIAGHTPVRAGLKTAMGQALGFAGAMLEMRQNCWALTIDVSGDGRNNIGPLPSDTYRSELFSRITVNALVIGQPDRDRPTDTRPTISQNELLEYFETEVITGPDAFAMLAQGYADYARAMRQKLLRELELPMLSAVEIDQVSWE